MPGFSSNTWYQFSEYSEIICQVHDLFPKLNVIMILKDSFDRVMNDVNFFQELGDLTDERRKRFRIHISMQILSLTVELTEDLAAICDAYRNSVKKGNKRVPEYLRNFRNPDQFYRKASTDIRFAAESVGYDPIKDVQNALKVQNIFRQIRDFREKYRFWYNSYKHGQRTIPMAISLDHDIHWGLYVIPKEFVETDDKVFTGGTESLLISTEEVDKYTRIANGVVQLWIDVRKIQFPKVFGHPFS